MTTLPRPLVQQLLAHAQSDPTNEICGLIASNEQQKLRQLKIDNRAEEPSTQFQMDAEQLIAAQKNMREREENLFAIYHSHPTASAEPSAQDIEQAGYPELLYLVISLNTKGVLELRAWRLDNGLATEEPLRI